MFQSEELDFMYGAGINRADQEYINASASLISREQPISYGQAFDGIMREIESMVDRGRKIDVPKAVELYHNVLRQRLMGAV